MLVQGREAGAGPGPQGIKEEGVFRPSFHSDATTLSCFSAVASRESAS